MKIQDELNKYRFIRIEGQSKFPPLEKEWQKSNNYSYADNILLDHINSGGNYGIVCGINGLLVLDIDVEDKDTLNKMMSILLDHNKEKLKKTFCVRTGKEFGYHFYYEVDPKEVKARIGDKASLKLKLKLDGKAVGDLKIQRSYVLGPGSIHPNGKTYETDGGEVEKISFNFLLEYLSPLLSVKENKPVKKIEKKLEETKETKTTDKLIHEGDRNNTLFRIGRADRDKGLELDAILNNICYINKTKCVPPLDDSEVRRIALSCAGYLPDEDLFDDLAQKDYDEETLNFLSNIIPKAREIMQTDDPLNHILDIFEKYHVGDRPLAKVIFLASAIQQVENSQGFHPGLYGGSGKGKSDVVETCLHLMPPSHYIKTDLSPKALFYHPIRPGTIIFCDDYKQNDEIDAIIKRSSSQFHQPIKHLTLSAKREPIELTMPQEIVWIITSVNADQDIQVLNRAITLDVDDSADTDEKVVKFVLDQAAEGIERFPLNDEVKLCRAMILDFKEKHFKVRIPFADKITWGIPENRRNLPIFLDTIKACAVWNHRQRQTDNDGYLIATREDFLSAKDLFGYNAEGMKTKLTKSEIKLAEIVFEADDHELTREEAASKMGVSVNRITQLCLGEKGRTGLTQKLVGFTYDKVSERKYMGDRTTYKSILRLAQSPKINTTDLVSLKEEGVEDEQVRVSV